MNDSEQNQTPVPSGDPQDRRLFLKGMGKWSGAAIMAAIAGSFVGTAPNAQGGWINRRGGWINGGGSWVNRSSGGGAWVNRSGGGGGGWVNRRSGGGSWVNRR